MLCFRDMSFCSAKCKTISCQRNYTPEVDAAAKHWMANPPVAFSDFSPNCKEYKPE